MRRFVVLALAGLLVLGGCSSSHPPPCTGPPSQLVFQVKGHPSLFVDIADTPSARAQGLMGQSRLPSDEGMAFLYDAPSADGFWMKDTTIPLSIAFWGADRRIQQIFDMRPCTTNSCRVYRASAPFVGAAEAPQGYFADHGIRVGDTVALHEYCG